MDNLDKIAFQGVDNYFKALSVFGYKGYKEVEKLLVLLFIEDLIKGPLNIYIDECDYKAINNALYCLFGSTCLIPYPEFITNYVQQGLAGIASSNPFRLTEDNELRFSENRMIRLVN